MSRQEMETCMVRACHTLRQPLHTHPSGHLGGWMTPGAVYIPCIYSHSRRSYRRRFKSVVVFLVC